MFQFNAHKYDFWPIYKSIQAFYPIGIASGNYTIYDSYPGIKKLRDLVDDNMVDRKNYLARWTHFIKIIEQRLGVTTTSTTHLSACFSGYLQLSSVTHGDITRNKELHFFVSLIGPYYTVIGKDFNVVSVDSKNLQTANCLIVSPILEYTQPFDMLVAAIENHFTGYRFVPFDICQQTIEGLDVKYDHPPHRIFNALFDNQVDFSIYPLGDDYYKAEAWIREGYIDKGEVWTAYPPGAFPLTD